MAVYAGIDEAGYGPLIGPLVVGCAAFVSETPEADFWKRLAHTVRPQAGGWDGLVVQDSKELFSRRLGLTRLEEGCLAFAACGEQSTPNSMGELLALIQAPSPSSSCPWYDDTAQLPLPVSAEQRRLDELRPLLAHALASAGVRGAFLRASPVFSPALNQEFAAGSSKSDIVFRQVVAHLRSLLSATDGDIFLSCDKLGGRNFYAALLQQSLGVWVRPLYESHKRSDYAFEIDGRAVRISFIKNGERASRTVALASMLSKYLRELFMTLINKYWCERIEGLQPTAGYVQDGRRFIKNIRHHPDYPKYEPLLVRLK